MYLNLEENIFHLSFDMCHLSFHALRIGQRWRTVDDENGGQLELLMANEKC